MGRAEDYLLDRATRPVTRAKLATAAGVSIRTLSRGFAARWGTGPMAFLKKRRMEATYRELLGADSCERSVTEIACRYVFTHFGRFSGEYRSAFGESPSQTLRHWRVIARGREKAGWRSFGLGPSPTVRRVPDCRSPTPCPQVSAPPVPPARRRAFSLAEARLGLSGVVATCFGVPRRSCRCGHDVSESSPESGTLRTWR